MPMHKINLQKKPTIKIKIESTAIFYINQRDLKLVEVSCFSTEHRSGKKVI
jgi:hypothetical protein